MFAFDLRGCRCRVQEEATPPEAKNPEEVNQAIELFKKKDFEGCAAKLNIAVKNHPELPPAEIIMAQLFGLAGAGANVRPSLERAVMEDPTDPQAYIILGNIAQDERRFTEADLLFGKAVDLLATFSNTKRKHELEPRALSGLAWVAEARQKWPAAQKDLEAMLKTLESLPAETTDQKKAKATATADALSRLGTALFEQYKAKDALEKLKEAKAADPDSILTPEARLGELYEQMGGEKNHKEAARWMKVALTNAANDPKTRLAVASWAVNTGDIEQAKINADKALELDKTSLNAKITCGVVALFQKDFVAAENYFDSALKQRPSQWLAKNGLALALCEQKDDVQKERAREYAEDIVRNNPKRPDAVSTYAWVLYRLGKLQNAEQAMNKSAELSGGSLNADTAYCWGQIEYDLGKKDAARTLIGIALKMHGPSRCAPRPRS